MFLQAVVHIGSPHVVTLPFLLETACFLRGDTSLTERDIESDGMNMLRFETERMIVEISLH